jgi:cell fate regulator YaaT (PSP1 superfamily)
MDRIILVRYGGVPEVARFTADAPETFERGTRVVVNSHRGVELGTVLEQAPPVEDETHIAKTDSADQQHVLRKATEADEVRYAESRSECEGQFPEWCQRIKKWGLQLELIDLEWMLDRKKLILYVLTGQPTESANLAIRAAASGFETVEVQPVNAEGLVHAEPAGKTCGSGGCCH